MKANEVNELQILANNILRIEVEVKATKLRNDFGELPFTTDISQEYLKAIYDKEVFKLLRESADEEKICRTAQAVEKRLYQSYTSETAGRLLGTWYRFATLGEDFVKKQLPKATFYRHRKQLVDAGISWVDTDVILKEYSQIPDGFTPTYGDSRRITEVDHRVLQHLKSVA